MIYDKKFTFSGFILNYNEVVGELLSNNNTLFQNYYQAIQHFQRANQKRLTYSAFISNYMNLFR